MESGCIASLYSVTYLPVIIATVYSAESATDGLPDKALDYSTKPCRTGLWIRPD